MSLIDMKICTKCKTEKPRDDFYKRAASKDGLDSICKPCRKTAVTKYAKENSEKKKEYHSLWEARNPGKMTAYKKKWKRLHREAVLAGRRTRSRQRTAYNNMRNARRRAVKRNATIAWANTFFIEEAYELAKLRTKVTGIKWHVDHIIPLRGKGVRGLHWEGNLQVIPAKVNMAKCNRYCSDNPHIRQSP